MGFQYTNSCSEVIISGKDGILYIVKDGHIGVV